MDDNMGNRGNICHNMDCTYSNHNSSNHNKVFYNNMGMVWDSTSDSPV